MKRLFVGIISLGLLLSVMSCGRGGKKLEEGKVKIVFMMWGDPEEKKAVMSYLRAFKKKYPDIGIKVIHRDSFSYNDKLKTMIAGGSPPDVFYVGMEDFYGYVSKGHLMNLDKFIEKDKKELNLDDFFKEPLDVFKYKGSYYGIAKDFAMMVLYYNMNLFDRYDLKYPDESWDWNKFLNAAKTLTKDLDGDGQIDQYGYIVETWASWYITWVYANGGRLFDENNVKWVFGVEPYLTRNAEAMQFLADLINKYHVAPSITATRNFGTYEAFMRGAVGMCSYGRWACLRFRNIKKFKWNYAVMPKGPVRRASTLFTVAYSMSSKTKHPNESWELLKFLVSPKAQIKTAETGHAIPTRKSIAYSDHFVHAPYVVRYQPQLKKIKPEEDPNLVSVKWAVMPPQHPKWLEIRANLDQKMQDVFLGKKKAVDAIKELQKKVENELLKGGS